MELMTLTIFLVIREPTGDYSAEFSVKGIPRAVADCEIEEARQTFADAFTGYLIQLEPEAAERQEAA